MGDIKEKAYVEANECPLAGGRRVRWHRLDYATKRILCKKGIGVVHFHVYNTSTIQSATHPPVIGYTEWWSTHVGNPMNNIFSSGPMSQTTQTFDWDENLDFKGNP